MTDNIEIFLCYAHKDESLMRELESQLSVLEKQGLITIWHDRMIAGGKDWKKEIETHLNSARIILLLVSADFMFSEYSNIEVKRAMERYNAGEAEVIPVILRRVMWENSVFGMLSPLPKDGKPVTSSSWSNHDEAWIDVVEGVQKAIDELRKPVVPIEKPGSSHKERQPRTQVPEPMKQLMQQPRTARELMNEGYKLMQQPRTQIPEPMKQPIRGIKGENPNVTPSNAAVVGSGSKLSPVAHIIPTSTPTSRQTTNQGNESRQQMASIPSEHIAKSQQALPQSAPDKPKPTTEAKSSASRKIEIAQKVTASPFLILMFAGLIYFIVAIIQAFQGHSPVWWLWTSDIIAFFGGAYAGMGIMNMPQKTFSKSIVVLSCIFILPGITYFIVAIVQAFQGHSPVWWLWTIAIGVMILGGILFNTFEET